MVLHKSVCAVSTFSCASSFSLSTLISSSTHSSYLSTLLLLVLHYTTILWHAFVQSSSSLCWACPNHHGLPLLYHIWNIHYTQTISQLCIRLLSFGLIQHMPHSHPFCPILNVVYPLSSWPTSHYHITSHSVHMHYKSFPLTAGRHLSKSVLGLAPWTTSKHILPLILMHPLPHL
jgi:hypothetical protein